MSKVYLEERRLMRNSETLSLADSGQVLAFIMVLAGLMEFHNRSRIALLTNSESMILSFRRFPEDSAVHCARKGSRQIRASWPGCGEFIVTRLKFGW